MTLHTLDTVSEGHVELSRQQQELQARQLGLQRSVSASLDDIAREKALVTATHAQLARMSTELRGQISETNAQIAEQMQQMGERHKQMLADLDEIQQQASEVLKQIESRGSDALARLALASEAQESALVALARINASVDSVAALAESARRQIDARVAWVSALVDGDWNRLQCWVLHACYLLTGMMLAAFLSAPRATRVALLVVVAGNLCVGVTSTPADALDVVAMTTLIAAATFVTWAVRQSWRLLSSLVRESSALAHAKPAQGDAGIQERLASGMRWLRQAVGLSSAKRDVGPAPARANERPYALSSDQSEDSARGSDQSDEGKVYSVPLRRFIEARDSRSGTPFSQASASRRACAGLRRDGQRCRLSAAAGSSFCRHHAAGLTS